MTAAVLFAPCLQQASRRDQLSALWRLAFTGNAAIALWRNPASTDIHLLVDLSPCKVAQKLQLHAADRGFAISPFINPDADRTLLLQPDVHIILSSSRWRVVTASEAGEEWLCQLEEIEDVESTLPYHTLPDSKSPQFDERKAFEARVNAALQAIQAGAFDKVVLARNLPVDFEQPPDLISLFLRLCEQQPDAFVSLLSTPQFGCWVGASPELLVAVQQQKYFHTEALAGTQPRAAQNPAQARWRQKEIEEQAMVSRYIIEQFKKLRLRRFIEHGPKTVAAGSLLHLETRYEVDMQAIDRFDVATDMLHLLHPTSAVCGLPKQPAMQFIEHHEKFDRALYAGYLGPVNMLDETRLYVNIRCMRIHADHFELFAGSGITAESDPAREWQETTLKCRTLQDAIHV